MRTIVLENFHYLDEETQTHISHDLRVFSDETNISFIIVGVWIYQGYLESLNNDLSGRITNINVNSWTKPQMKVILDKGCQALNITIHSSAENTLIHWSYRNVGLLQRATRTLLAKNGIHATQKATLRNIGSPAEVMDVYREIAHFHQERLERTVSRLTSRLKNQLEKTILRSLLLDFNSMQLLNGISLEGLYSKIANRTNRTSSKRVVRAESMIESIQNIERLSITQSRSTPLFHYSHHRRQVTSDDAEFLLFRQVFRDSITSRSRRSLSSARRSTNAPEGEGRELGPAIRCFRCQEEAPRNVDDPAAYIAYHQVHECFLRPDLGGEAG